MGDETISRIFLWILVKIHLKIVVFEGGETLKIVLPPRRRASFAKSADRGKRLEKYPKMMENEIKIHPQIYKTSKQNLC